MQGSGPILPVVTLLIILTLGLLITRIATVALTFTGLSREIARFQARSAFTGVGFTTVESEHILDHPVRRRIVMLLMITGNAGIITSISSLILVFVEAQQGQTGFYRAVILMGSGLCVLWALGNSRYVDRGISKVIAWALRRWTQLDVHDYPALLHLSDGYSVGEMRVDKGDWVAGKTLYQLRLPDEGIHVLGIRRHNGEYLGAPTAGTYIRAGDTMLMYARTEDVSALERRRADEHGDREHKERAEEQKTVIQAQQMRDIRASERGSGDSESGQ